MHHLFIIAAMLLGLAAAVPHHDHQHHEKYPIDKHHGTGHPSFIGSHAPIVTGAAPSKHHNHTIKHHTITTTLIHYIEAAPGSGSASPDESPNGPENHAEDKHKISPAAAVDTCGQPVTVTVTTADTVTVTAGGETPVSPPIKPVPQQKDDDTKPSEASRAAEPSNPVVPPTEDSAKEAPPAKEEKPAPSKSDIASPAPQPSTSAPATSDDTPPPKAPAAAENGLPFKTKRGIMAVGSAKEAIAKAMGTGKVSWAADWYSGPPHDIADSLTFVPQMYGKTSDNDGSWTSNAKKAIGEGKKYFLSFGEPNAPGVNNMDAGTAAQIWMDKLEPYTKQGVTVGSPANLQNAEDFTWLNEFVDKCTGCNIGFVAVHWFYKAEKGLIPGFKQTLQSAKAVADKLGVGVWVDNFCASGSVDDQKQFLGEVVPWMDEQDWIHAYAYVPEASSQPMTEGNDLNELGQFYANL